MKWADFISNVIKWADDRDLLHSSNAEMQYLKIIEELGELCRGILKNDKDLIIDSIGDGAVTLVVYAKQLSLIIPEIESHVLHISDAPLIDLISDIAQTATDANESVYASIYALYNISVKMGLDFNHCLQTAWDEIKDRKGVTKNGTFIKD